MATFTATLGIILGMKTDAWLGSALEQLAHAGEVGRSSVEFLSTRKTRIRFMKLPRSAGAIWFLDRNIYINTRHFNPETAATHPRVLSLIVHEVHHLKQGWHTAFSVYGELDAWQVDFNFQKSLTGRYPNAAIAELCALPLSYDRAVLKRAAELMQQYAGKGYRIDLYPVFPFVKELGYWLNRLLRRA